MRHITPPAIRRVVVEGAEVSPVGEERVGFSAAADVNREDLGLTSDTPRQTGGQPMSDTCTHLDWVADVTPNSSGCEECLRMGGRWVHLRMCMSCGHVGCCDDSPNRHATAHFRATLHPIIQSYEPGEQWWYCYIDDLAFLSDAAPSFAHS